MYDPKKIKSSDYTNNTDLENPKEIATEPHQAVCKLCVKNVTTFVQTDFNFFSIFLIFLTLYFFPFFMSLPILCITLPLFQNVTHSCPYCLSVISTIKFYTIEQEGKVK